MAEELTITRIAHDPSSDEFVLYLLEQGPWPDTTVGWELRLSQIQERVLAAFDVAVDGYLAQRFPLSVGKPVRIQVDSPLGSAPELEQLIDRIAERLKVDQEFRKALDESRFVRGLRVVTGHRLGRFGGGSSA